MMRNLLTGVAAVAAGTTALDARPASTTPDDTVREMEKQTGASLSAEGPDSDEAANRRSALGAMLRIAAGLGTGALYGAVRPQLGNVPLVVLGLGAGLAAPGCRTWSRTSPTAWRPRRCGTSCSPGADLEHDPARSATRPPPRR